MDSLQRTAKTTSASDYSGYCLTVGDISSSSGAFVSRWAF